MITPIIEISKDHWSFKNEQNKFLKYFDLKWEGLSSFGKSNIVKSFSIWFILVPFLVKFFESIPEKINLMIFGESFVFALSSPLPNQIYLFYFSSLFFFIGNIIYIVKCPEIIKNYDGYSDFKEKDGSSEKVVVSMESFCFHDDVTNEAAHAITFDFISKYCREQDKKNALNQAEWHEKLNYCVFIESQIANIFSYVRSASNYLDRKIRLLCAGSYYIGAIIISYLLVQNLFVVVEAFASNL